jgi:hypothetical protein
MRPQHSSLESRRAVAAVLVVIIVPVLLGFAVLTIDVGHMYNVRAELQTAADAASLAAADRLASGAEYAELRDRAREFANFNHPNHGDVFDESEFSIGVWDKDLADYFPGLTPANAVRVVTRRSTGTSNPVTLFFAGIFGVHDTDISASAVAWSAAAPPGSQVRFLIDDEMFDTDVPAIEDFADSIGWSTDDLLRDGNGDGFIDFPPTIIELPTGQVGDEALFAVGPGFPFGQDTDPSLEDFLLFREGINQHGIPKSMMDPLLGVEPESNPANYPSFVHPDSVLVSPVYKSDVSNTEPGVNALGERRGLVAFKIIGIGYDPPGSYLPNLIIEILSPTMIDTGESVIWGAAGGGGVLQLVR